MKKLILSVLFLSLIALLPAQTIQLPGTGSNQINLTVDQINASSNFSFTNPEYQVIGFTLSFATDTDPHFTANSTNNQFTNEMLASIPHLVSGTEIALQVNLKAPGAGHEAWAKNYILHLDE